MEEARRKEEEATVALLAASAAPRLSKRLSSSSSSSSESEAEDKVKDVRRMEATVQQSSYNGDVFAEKGSSSNSSRSATPSNTFHAQAMTNINTEFTEPKQDSSTVRRMKLLEVSQFYYAKLLSEY